MTYIKKLKDFEKHLKIKKEGITITISGLSGSGKSTVGKAIAKAFKLKFKNMGDIFREFAKKEKVSIEKFSKRRNKEIDLMVDKKALKLAKKGGVVLIGRLSGWVAGENADIKIWIECDLDVRAKRVAKRERISFKSAKKKISERDEADLKIYKNLYGIDLNDKKIYDILFNNTNATYEEALNLPIKVIKLILKNGERT